MQSLVADGETKYSVIHDKDNYNGKMSKGKIVRRRDARGRFLPGKSGNPKGRPPGTVRTRLALKRALTESWSDDEINEIGKQLLLHAFGKSEENFNIDAVKLILNYAIGRPTPAPDESMVVSHEELLGIFERFVALLEQTIPELDRREKIAAGIWDILRSVGIYPEPEANR